MRLYAKYKGGTAAPQLCKLNATILFATETATVNVPLSLHDIFSLLPRLLRSSPMRACSCPSPTVPRPAAPPDEWDHIFGGGATLGSSKGAAVRLQWNFLLQQGTVSGPLQKRKRPILPNPADSLFLLYRTTWRRAHRCALSPPPLVEQSVDKSGSWPLLTMQKLH